MNSVVWEKKDNIIQYMDTVMRYYLGIDTDKLHDEEWLITFLQLVDIRKREREESNG